jgi:hypothetical protein
MMSCARLRQVYDCQNTESGRSSNGMGKVCLISDTISPKSVTCELFEKLEHYCRLYRHRRSSEETKGLTNGERAFVVEDIDEIIGFVRGLKDQDDLGSIG